jgi:hypothetical protein
MRRQRASHMQLPKPLIGLGRVASGRCLPGATRPEFHVVKHGRRSQDLLETMSEWAKTCP